MSKEQEWFLFSFNRAKSWTGVCVWVSEGVRACVCTSMSGSECEHVCACESLYVCVHVDVTVCWCVNVCVFACLTEGWKERRCLENLKNQSADWTQLPPSASAFLLESPQSRLFLIFHMPLTQSHFQGPRMECAPSRRALSHVWLSRLFKRQETGGWFSAHGLIWIHISPYTHSCIPRP